MGLVVKRGEVKKGTFAKTFGPLFAFVGGKGGRKNKKRSKVGSNRIKTSNKQNNIIFRRKSPERKSLDLARKRGADKRGMGGGKEEKKKKTATRKKTAQQQRSRPGVFERGKRRGKWKKKEPQKSVGEDHRQGKKR